ncbi:hypothetical protein N656DRAFT_136302 [Canariomyces notabilis]|uniref:Secreted protein n=1 Tax=Canariomyces notabilis TaxID=2074819 RepID=A0AAN6TCV0_9PEZI|nr:hypothetical protein N656DRAFT_136302 [Canariomyces arenarius]
MVCTARASWSALSAAVVAAARQLLPQIFWKPPSKASPHTNPGEQYCTVSVYALYYLHLRSTHMRGISPLRGS